MGAESHLSKRWASHLSLDSGVVAVTGVVVALTGGGVVALRVKAERGISGNSTLFPGKLDRLDPAGTDFFSHLEKSARK